MNWFQKISNQSIINEAINRIQYVQNIKKNLNKTNTAKTYPEHIKQQILNQQKILPYYQELIQWMVSQSHLIDPQTQTRWQSQIQYFQEEVNSIQQDILELNKPFNPQEHNAEEAIEWAIETNSNIEEILTLFEIEYETIEFDNNNSVTVLEIGGILKIYDGGQGLIDAYEWVNDIEPEDYITPQNTSEDFWESNQSGNFAYHGTNEEYLPEIIKHGLQPRDATRGLSNKNTGSAVFTSSEKETADNYYDIVLSIDLGAMQKDGYMPEVSYETPIEESQLREAVAHKLGLEDYFAEVEGGLAEDTIIFYGPIPPKYLKQV